MMDVLILGYSSIVKRRVLPALISLAQVERIHVASRKGFSGEGIPHGKRGRVFNEYGTALEECCPCLCYVSLPNTMHAEWAHEALESGFHVIIDKPAVTNVADATKLVDIAERKSLCLAEANVWHYHPLAQILKGTIVKEIDKPLQIFATFSSPPLEYNNFRYDPGLGSGILLDRGPYAVSCGNFFFGEPPKEIICRVTSFDKKGIVDISCNIMMVYPSGSVLQGFFSLAAEYRNTLSITGSSYCFDVDRIFTPPADYVGNIRLRRKNKTETIAAPQGDIFALFISDVLNSIYSKSFSRFSRKLVEDAQILDDLIASAEET
jgi:predicted dehydrogenase